MKAKIFFLAAVLISISTASCAPTKKNTDDGSKASEQRERLNQDQKKFEKTFDKH